MSGEPARIGVPTAEGSVDPERLASAVDAGGGSAIVDDLDAIAAAGPDAILAPGASVLRSVVQRRPDVPVLPIGVDCGLPSVDPTDVEAAVATVVAGTATTESAPLLAVAIGGTTERIAFRDVTVLTAAPARISEFAIRHDGGRRLDTVRADGVVIATPAGSGGYATAGGGALCSTDALSVVPVAPFRIDRDRWVVPMDEVAIRVQRDEAAVTVEVDGEAHGTVGRDAEVSVTPTATLGVLVAEGSSRAHR